MEQQQSNVSFEDVLIGVLLVMERERDSALLDIGRLVSFYKNVDDKIKNAIYNCMPTKQKPYVSEPLVFIYKALSYNYGDRDYAKQLIVKLNPGVGLVKNQELVCRALRHMTGLLRDYKPLYEAIVANENACIDDFRKLMHVSDEKDVFKIAQDGIQFADCKIQKELAKDAPNITEIGYMLGSANRIIKDIEQTGKEPEWVKKYKERFDKNKILAQNAVKYVSPFGNLQDENAKLMKENTKLMEENTKLMQKLDNLEKQNQLLAGQIKTKDVARQKFVSDLKHKKIITNDFIEQALKKSGFEK